MRNWIAGTSFALAFVGLITMAQEINWTMANALGILMIVGAGLYITKRERTNEQAR
jgi:hypothetical protein